jgi:hypothetical protein
MLPKKSPDNTDSTVAPAEDDFRRDGWIPAAAVWASGISAVLYFVVSEGIHHHVRFLIDSAAKILRALG